MTSSTTTILRLACLAALLALGATACDDDDETPKEPARCTASAQCLAGRVCEPLGDGETRRCAAPLVVQGVVQDEATGAGVVGAEVLVLDEAGSPASGVAETGTDGVFVLPVSLARNDDGTPAARRVTLRASAQGYETFPSAVRRALPLNLNEATPEGSRYLYEGELTALALPPVADVATLGEVRGRVTGTDQVAGILVTASSATAPTGRSALTAGGGAFVIHNLPAGSYSVLGYATGVQLTPVTGVAVAAGQTVQDVTLTATDAPTGTVSGSVNPVAGGCTGGTSVVLVPRETLLPSTVFPLNALSTIRAEVPRGLRAPAPGTAPNLTGNYAITGVPDGTYEVLAAYENEADPCVFDPSNISGGFLIQEITVPTAGSSAITVPAFKVTGAVQVVGPGAGNDPDQVAGLTPTFSWQAYSSSKNYQVAVYDASGQRLWVTTACADADSSCDTLAITYGTAGAGTTQPAQAPALEAGHLYQWRVIALGSRNGETCGFTGAEIGPDRECISTSEDLKGLFRTAPAAP